MAVQMSIKRRPLQSKLVAGSSILENPLASRTGVRVCLNKPDYFRSNCSSCQRSVPPYQSAAARTNQRKEQNNDKVRPHAKLFWFPFALSFFLILKTLTDNNNPFDPVLTGKKVGTWDLHALVQLFLDTGFHHRSLCL